MTILLLAGSPSFPSRSTRLLQHIGEKLAKQGHRCARLSVLDLPPEALLHADFKNADIRAACGQVERADAVVIATPVYKAAYSGLLKAFIDLLPQDGLAGKLALPIATGGSQSHMLVLDYALRPVLASLSPRHILPGVYATDSQIRWTEQGVLLDPAIEQRIVGAVDHLSACLQAQHAFEHMPVPAAAAQAASRCSA